MKREPGYCHHKASGRAYVRINGKDHYLGKFGSPESHEAYARLKAQWLVQRACGDARKDPSGPSIATVCVRYLEHAQVYYGNGKELDALKLAIRPLADLYAERRAAQFGPLEFKAVRQWWLNKECSTEAGKCSRQYINAMSNRLFRVFKWAVGEGLVPPAVYQAIKCVEPLKRGRTSAPEAEPVGPVSQEIVEATLPHMPPIVADMARVQLLLGCRPGEVCKLTPAMIDKSGDVWQIRLAEHKNAHRGKARIIYAGPLAQEVLRRYLDRPEDQHLFRPCDTVAAQRRERGQNRKTPLGYGNSAGTNRVRKPKRSPGESYTRHSYARAIERACDKAFPPPPEVAINAAAKRSWVKSHRWTPNQLRHSRGTDVRRHFGLEAAASILGHSQVSTTQIYAESDRERAIQVARAIG